MCCAQKFGVFLHFASLLNLVDVCVCVLLLSQLVLVCPTYPNSFNVNFAQHFFRCFLLQNLTSPLYSLYVGQIDNYLDAQLRQCEKENKGTSKTSEKIETVYIYMWILRHT